MALHRPSLYIEILRFDLKSFSGNFFDQIFDSFFDVIALLSVSAPLSLFDVATTVTIDDVTHPMQEV